MSRTVDSLLEAEEGEDLMAHLTDEWSKKGTSLTISAIRYGASLVIDINFLYQSHIMNYL